MRKIWVFIAALGFASLPMVRAGQQPDVMPLTIKSSQVRHLLDQTWVLDSDQGEQSQAIEVMRKAVKIEPEFAMGHEILAQISLDPAEQVSEQKQAFANREHANASEQIVIEWFQEAADHKLIPAITNMNEVLHQYPHDRWLVFLANSWLMEQTQYERAAAVYENSGLTDSPGLVNNAAYTYANMRQFSKAFSLMDKFVALMPKDPNPQDSYAEILRMAGYYTVAIDHYRVALSINPQFYSSQFGIADTYLLMGDETRARKEYDAAFKKFSSLGELDRIQWRTREATTYIYEGDLAAADKALQALVDYAHTRHLSQVEAETYRQMAMYQPEKRRGMDLLHKAEIALSEGSNISETEAQQEAAQILRTRVYLAIGAGDAPAADLAVGKLARLSVDSNDKLIDSAFDGAAGAHLFYERKYRQAIPYLEEDMSSPLSLKLLTAAYQATGYYAGARRTQEILTHFNYPTIEQAMIVPAFRKCLANPACEVNVKNAAMTVRR
jgi:tetratricopeptide (TPR) repeat protein